MTTYRSEDVAAVYWATFGGTARYAIHSGGHWLPRHGEPPTALVVDALRGDGPSLAAFFLNDASKTHVLAIDIDAEDDWGAIEAITGVLLGAGVACYPEHSRRGGHIWIVLDQAIPAIIGRRALMLAVERAGLDPTDKRLELRPNTDQHTSDFAGGSLRAPWMPHPATGARFGLLDPATFLPLDPKIANALSAIEQADTSAILRLAERYVPPRLRTPPPMRYVAGAVSSVLAERFGVEAAPGKSIRCPFHHDRHPSMKIAADDRRAWCHAVACPANEDGRGITAWQAARLAGVS